MTKHVLALAIALSLATGAFAQESAPLQPQMAEKLRAQYPNTKFREVRKAPVAGLYEVVMGENVAYTDEDGRYFLFGHMYDMQEQVDLTAARKADSKKVEFPAEHLANAIKVVKGNGSRVLAVFSDPDCPYCKKLEVELQRLDNVTIYTFLYPLESLHPEAKTKSISVWCATDRAKAWSALMLAGTRAPLKACENPINDNLVLGSKLGVVGTPTLIAADGRTLPGAAPAAKIDQWLNLGAKP